MAAPLRSYATAALVGFLLTGGLVAGRLWPNEIAAGTDLTLRTIRGMGGLGWAVFAPAQTIVAVSGVLPASPFGVAAGAVYGIPLGFGLAAVSTLAGAVLAFRLSRSPFRLRIERWLRRRARLRNIDAVLSGESWRFVCLLRVSPIMPFAATRYALGLSGVSFGNYIIGTLASLPALLGYVCLGGLADAGLAAHAEGAGLIRWVLLGVGVLATVVLTLRIGRVILRAGLAAPAARSAAMSDTTTEVEPVAHWASSTGRSGRQPQLGRGGRSVGIRRRSRGCGAYRLLARAESRGRAGHAWPRFFGSRRAGRGAPPA
jgi:uncharacterized membrane protein YdjX (TVP38/TMEM64 family)